MKKLFLLSFLIVACLVADKAFAVACSYSSDHPYALMVDYLDGKVNTIACNQRVYSDDGLCTDGTQLYQTDNADKGQFREEYNQRNQEVVYTIAFLYQEPCSDYYGNVYLLNRVLFGLDYLRRSQGDNGGISEDGWKGVDYNDVDCDGEPNERDAKDNATSCDSSNCTNVGNCTSGDDETYMCNDDYYRCDPPDGSGTSVSGFTYYAAAQAINILYSDSNFQTRLTDMVAGGGDGVADDPRYEMYARLLSNAAYYLTNGGRGHAPNQDVINLLALHALNQAYAYLEGIDPSYSVPDSSLDDLMDDLDLDSGDPGYDSTTSLSALRDEILYGSPDYAVAGNNEATGESDGDDCNGDGDETDAGEGDGGNGFDRWFTDGALLLEKGYRDPTVCEPNTHSVGYDGNYGWVTLRGLALLRDWDSSVDTFLESYINWFQYFLYVDLDLEKGGFQVSALARRKWEDGDIKLPVLGMLQDYPAMHTVFNATLEHFMADPDGYFSYDGAEIFKGMYVIPAFLEHWTTEPTASDYILPLNRLDDGNPSDFSDYTDYETDQTGALISLLEITNTDNSPSGVRYHVNDWWNGEKEYYYGSSTATISFSSSPSVPSSCDLSQTPTFDCEDSSGDVLERVTGKTTNGSGTITSLTVEAATPVAASTTILSYVDGDGDGTGDHFDDDGDGYCEGTSCLDGSISGDCDESTNGRNPGLSETCGDGIDQDCDESDSFCDTDSDGVTDDVDTCSSTSPLDTSDTVNASGCALSQLDSDGDKLTDYQEVVTYGTNPNDTDTDDDYLSDYQEVQNGSNPLVYTDWLSPILSFIMDGDDDGDGYDSESDGGDDCDDTDASIYVGATETCGDGVDQDCDGSDLSCNDVDNDSDGYTENGGDCDDANASMNPGVWEIFANGVDDNCDGVIDNDDYDGDGYWWTTGPGGESGGDCDDEDASMNPGASETCEDGIDQDCDGSDRICDADSDGVADASDVCPSTTPIDVSDTVNVSGCALSQLDTDSDGLTDYQETVAYGTNPLLRDTDGDRLSDGLEVNRYGTDPLSRDSDGDRLSDGQEVKRYHTDPLDTDSDDDGLSDFREIRLGRDPLDPTA